MNRTHVFHHLVAIALGLTLASCASRTPHAIYIAPLSAVITSSDRVSTHVSAVDGRMPEMERQVLADKITQRVQAMARPGMGIAHTYELAVNITRYVRGNGFVRTAAPGFGQIHLDGVVTVYQMPKRVRVGEFMINKSFAMGGIYGVSVSIDTIANTYAQAVAETVCGLK